MFKSKKMKKIFSLVIIALMLFSHPIYPVTLDNNTNIVQQDSAAESDEVVADESLGFHQELKKRFIEGGPGFMGIVLLCLILGLAIAIERIIFLNLSSTDSEKQRSM